MKCSFKSCHNIVDYTTQFDDISALPIITNAMIKICIYHKEEILNGFPETKFRKILFVNGIQRYLICQRCGHKWTPYGFAPATTTEKFGNVPVVCVNCHSRAYQVKPPE
jgi:hypothetical protein